jgi:hypothetical protein
VLSDRLVGRWEPGSTYVEFKAGGLRGGQARIDRVSFSKEGRTIRYRDREFRSLKRSGFKANYLDVLTGAQFWISGPKKEGSDRLYGEHVPLEIDDDVREEYWFADSRPAGALT